jgi:hypothetical protein
MQVHSLLHCLSEVLLHADGEDAILYAQVAQLGAECSTIQSRDSSRPRDRKQQEPHVAHVY